MRKAFVARMATALMAASAGVLPAQGMASGQMPDIRPGIPYAQAHAKMLAAGYKPYRVLDPKSDAYHVNIFNRHDVYSIYPEVNSCAGTGDADCKFIFAKSSSDIVAIHTTGEEVRSLMVHDLRRLTKAQADRMY